MTSHTSEGTIPWPADLAAEFRSKGYWEDRTLGAYILDTADRLPEKIAIVDGDVRLSYAEAGQQNGCSRGTPPAVGPESGRPHHGPVAQRLAVHGADPWRVSVRASSR